MALLLGITAPVMMLLPYNRDPATGSRIPSISTGGATMNAAIYATMETASNGNMRTPNQPIYSLLEVLRIKLRVDPHQEEV
jgi:hypothetical protein